VKKTKPSSENPLSSTIRDDGLPSLFIYINLIKLNKTFEQQLNVLFTERMLQYT